MKKSDDLERRRKFFFGEADVDTYDVSADMHTHRYSQMHEVLIDLLRRDAQSGKTTGTVSYAVLDIGSGTGAGTLSVLSAIPRSVVVAVDLCAPMHERHREKLTRRYGKLSWSKRCALVESDILGPLASPKALLRHLDGLKSSAKFDAVISALTLHHLKPGEKRRLYKRIHEMLTPNGIFVNADLFTFDSETLGKAGEVVLCDWIAHQFSDPDPRFRSAVAKLGARVKMLGEKWIAHVQRDNIPLPIERALTSKTDSGKSGRRTAASETELLRSTGFSEIGCPFRYWEVAVLWAKKTPNPGIVAPNSRRTLNAQN